MKTAVYLRVSTADQKTESQLLELERWVLAQEPGSVVWPTPYEDHFTGRTMDRPGFERLMADARARRLGAIVIWRLDRLGRTTRGLCELFDELQALDVDLISLRDGLSLRTPSGRLLARILASVAEFETEVRGERQRAGINRVRQENGGRCPWGGAKKGDPARCTVTPEQAAEMRRLKADGRRTTDIARLFKVTRQTVARHITASAS